MGMEATEDMRAVKSQAKPAFVPSASIEVNKISPAPRFRLRVPIRGFLVR